MNRNMEALTWALHARKITPTAFRLLIQLCGHVNSNRNDYAVWPSHRLLAESVEISISGVKRHLKELVDAGYLVIRAGMRGNGGRASNVYEIAVNSSHRMPDGRSVPAKAPLGQSEPYPLGQSDLGAQVTPDLGAQVTADLCIEPLKEGTSERRNIPPLPSEGAPPTENQDLFGATSESPEDVAVRKMRDLLGSIMTRWKALSESNKLIPNVRNLDDRRRKTIVRLTETFTETTPEALWDEVFARIAESQFLRGLSAPGKGRDEPWAVRFDWLINKTNFQKVLEGNFRDNRRDHESFDPVSGRRLTPVEIATNRTNERIRSGIERARAAGHRADVEPLRLGYDRPGDL